METLQAVLSSFEHSCTKCFFSGTVPSFDQRYMGNSKIVTLSIFHTENTALEFFLLLNKFHPTLRFTMESESESKLPLMDVFLEQIDYRIVRSEYRKPMFTGLYTWWDLFAPTSQKINLI